MSGFTTNGLSLAVGALTGNEQAAFDTQLGQGLTPESEAISVLQLVNFANSQVFFSTDSGATQALTTAMVVPTNGTGEMYHTSSGGTTPTLTTPTAAQIITAAGANFVVGSTFTWVLLNSNSGTATLAGGTGVTISGTATTATTVKRTYKVTYTAAGAVTFTNVGSGSV